MQKPRKLAPGDTIAVVSPSWGGPSKYPHIFDNGLDILKTEFGLRVKEYPTARMDPDELHDNPRIRAKDINDAFADASVAGIICSIGGSDSIRILEYLDIDSILKHPKMIMGFSDSTTLLGFLNMHGLVTYYGPSIMAGFSYLKCFPDAIDEYRHVLFDDSKYEIKPFRIWADSYAKWNDVQNTGKISEARKDNNEHRWINKGSIVQGRLWGGCVEVLDMMNGTHAWPSIDFWNGRILILETSEDKPTPYYIGHILRNYGIQGILSRINGLLIAKPKSYSDDEKDELQEEVKRVVIGEFERTDLNMIANMDFGHTDPRHILPFGIAAEIDPRRESIRFVEDMFS